MTNLTNKEYQELIIKLVQEIDNHTILIEIYTVIKNLIS